MTAPSAAPGWVIAHLRPGERIVWSCRPSMYGLIPIGFGTLVTIVFFLAALQMGLDPGRPLFLRLPGPVALFFALASLGTSFVAGFVRLRFTTYVVTDDRFYSVTSFLSSTVRSVPLSRLTDVSLRQGPVMRLFGLWTARISAYGEAGATFAVPAIREGERLLAETSAGLLRGANASWLLRGD